MSRKASRKKATKPAKKTKTTNKPAKPEPATVYFAVREMVSVNRSYTEPDRVFASRNEAQKYAAQLNRELREFTNPFDTDGDVEWLLKAGEKGLTKLVKKLGAPVPKVPEGERFVNWEEWWNRHYFDLTAEQRDAIWDALDQFNWYIVKKTTVE